MALAQGEEEMKTIPPITVFAMLFMFAMILVGMAHSINAQCPFYTFGFCGEFFIRFGVTMFLFLLLMFTVYKVREGEIR